MYTGPKLVELLAQQHQNRISQQGLLQQGTFTISWRAKVGSYPHPDLETIISAAEPAGNWQHDNQKKLNVAENWQKFRQLPLNGYIPGSSLRGLVRDWAHKNNIPRERIRELLGDQDTDTIYTGKIQFLDAYPLEATPISLDIVNPQQSFQVYHQGQSTPLSFYTLGDGKKPIKVKIAIRGIPNQTTSEEVKEVWGWLEQAVCLLGVGGRTASGYGSITNAAVNPDNLPGYKNKVIHFELYSQGSYGVTQGKNAKVQLRPSHWRGWLRSWLLRFLLGVMSKSDAETTLGELLGSIGEDNSNQAQKGCVRLKLHQGGTWGEDSGNGGSYRFYTWKGKLEIIAPEDILTKIILPVIRFALSVGGVGRGWRRPLHIFSTDKCTAARGCYLKMIHQVNDKLQNLALHPNKPEVWQNTYQKWLDAVKSRWSKRVRIGVNDRLEAEVFSPTTCAIYTLPGPDREPVNFSNNRWTITKGVETRGDGMELIYLPTYKRKPAVGGNADRVGASCSWVSIRRVGLKNEEYETDCQETVCIFMGGKTPRDDHLRTRFLKDLDRRDGGIHLWGVQPQ